MVNKIRIHTLGTSHGDATFCRFNSSTCYETMSGACYMVDCGAPAEALLRRNGLNVSDVKAIFITHMHDDHVGGMTGFLKQVQKYTGGRTEPVRVFFPEERAKEAFGAWFYVLHLNPDSEYFDYHVTVPGDIYEDENVKVSAINTRHLRYHGQYVSFAYILEFKNENVTILHTGDLHETFSDFPQIAYERHFDACLTEATHHKPEVAAEILKGTKLSKLILVHVGNRWHNIFDGVLETHFGEKELLEYYKELPFDVNIAHDGEVFNIYGNDKKEQ